MSADDDAENDDTASLGAASDRGVDEETDTSPGNAELAVLGSALASGDSTLMSRYMAARYAGLAYGGDRDYYETLGYDRHPGPREFYAKYLRNDIARTIVREPASTAWRERPRVIDDANEGHEDEAATEFEKAVEFLFDEFRLLHYLERWDIATGLGEYGVLMLGLREPSTDGDSLPNLRDPVDEGTLDPVEPDAGGTIGEDGTGGLAYMSVFSQESIVDIEAVSNPADPRYGMPEMYQIEFETGDVNRTEWVHHSRVLHAAEDLLQNEVFGTPRLKPVYNRLMDLEKVVGGSAEMFWRGARRDLHLNYQGDGSPSDSEALQEQAEEWVHQLRNTLRTTNVEVQDLGGQEVDPSGVVEQLLKLISGETGIPKRILTGSERGELASTQDRATWLGRVGERQEQFCEPMQLRPLLDRLVILGILPKPQGGSYTVEWPDLFELNELERAELQNTKAQALKNSAPDGDPGQLAYVAEIREAVLSWDPKIGGETSLDAEENPEEREREAEDEADAPPEDIPADEVDEFEELFEDLDTEANREALADGGR